ncbi:MAG: GHKL domain-containing protein, partial [Coprobacillus sp.]
KKRYLVSIVFLWAIYFIIFILLFIFHVPMPYWADRVELICFIMLAITIYCCIKESKYNSFSKQFLVLSGISFITYLFIFILTSFVNLYLHEYIVIIFKEAQTLYCRPLLFWIFTTFLFILFILTVWEILQSRIHNLKEVNEMKLHGRLLNLQMDSAKREIDFLKTSQQQSVIYRHDMRHHFSLINNYLSHNEIENAKEYVAQVQKDIDAITPIKYCENNTVNLILSSFTHKATELGVTLILDVKLPSQLSIPETDLCSVLSNGLENAITATSLVDDPTHKTVSLSCSIHNGKLLISIENTYTGVITFKDGLPQSNQYGHGFGTKSIALIAEKQNGFCTFEASDEHFILRFAIPLIQ